MYAWEIKRISGWISNNNNNDNNEKIIANFFFSFLIWRYVLTHNREHKGRAQYSIISSWKGYYTWGGERARRVGDGGGGGREKGRIGWHYNCIGSKAKRAAVGVLPALVQNLRPDSNVFSPFLSHCCERTPIHVPPRRAFKNLPRPPCSKPC